MLNFSGQVTNWYVLTKNTANLKNLSNIAINSGWSKITTPFWATQLTPLFKLVKYHSIFINPNFCLSFERQSIFVYKAKSWHEIQTYCESRLFQCIYQKA